MNQKGLIPILILIGLVVVTTIAVGGVLYINKTLPDFKIQSNTNTEFTYSPPPTSSNSNSQSNTQHLSAFQILLGRIRATPSSSPSPSPIVSIPTPTPTTRPSPTVGVSATPTPTPAPVVRKNTCDVNVIYGKLDPSQISSPLLVTLIYSFISYNNVYMTGAQWDFDGDGSWDTDMSQSNGTIEHTFSNSGTYNVKLRVKGSDGSITDVCSKSVTVNSPATPTPTPQASTPKRVFVTSTTYSGNLGGVSGADVRCQASANNVNLGGTWKAWISDTTTSAASRLTHIGSPYLLLDGTVIASNWGDLTDGSIQHAINLSEYTSVVDAGNVWTNTTRAGEINTDVSIQPAHCQNWTNSLLDNKGSIGSTYSGSTDNHWTESGYGYCNSPARLFCFEQ